MASIKRFWFVLLRENDVFCNFCAFWRSMILNYKFYNVSDFELKKLQHVRIWIQKNTTRQILREKFDNALHFEIISCSGQILKQNYYNVSDFQSKFLGLARLWINFFIFF